MADEHPDSSPSMAETLRGEARISRRLGRTHRCMDIHIHGSSAQGMRLDKYLPLICPSLSRSLFQLWIRRRELSVNGIPARPAQLVQRNDHIVLRARLPPNPSAARQQGQALEILYEDADILVVNKPPGQLVHQAGRVFHGTLLGQVQAYLEKRGEDPEQARLINRIDRDTSGLVLVGIHPDIQRQLSKALEQRDVEKTYLALCQGIPEPAHGHWREAIGARDSSTPMRMVRADGQPCHTEYEVLESRQAVSLLRIYLHTGRQHQIRVHAAYHGHALVGDWLYGEACQGLPGQALHAHRLCFTHPRTQRPLCIEAALDQRIAALWQACKEQPPRPRQLEDHEQQRCHPELSQQRQRRLPEWIPRQLEEAIRNELQPPAGPRPP